MSQPSAAIPLSCAPISGLTPLQSTEEAKLQNVYEKLLRDIVPDDQIEPMLKDPLGPLWKEAKVVARIRRRLWRHLNVFEENVRRMNDAMEEMKAKLGIGPDGKVGGSFPPRTGIAES